MITTVRFSPKTLEKWGLSLGEPMRGLGPFVVLAGPNGGGKSRLLRALREQVALTAPARAQETDHRQSLSQLRALAAVQPNIQARTMFQQQIEELENCLAVLDEIEVTAESHEVRVVDLTYLMGARIQNADDMPVRNQVAAADATGTAGFGSAYLNLHAYASVVARHLCNERHPDLAAQSEAQNAAKDAHEFNRIVQALLGAEITWSPNRSGLAAPWFLGRPFDPAELSDGQRILFTWAIILHRQTGHLKGAVVLVDEPEVHLHADACVKALTRLRDDILGHDGQIWIATHSIPLIAAAGIDSLYLVENGRVEYAGNRVPEVVERLVGGEGGSERLRGFLADADDIGLHSFAAQCLVEPLVAGDVDGDPQELSFASLVRARLAEGCELRVLDYGAGRGRLGMGLHRSLLANPPAGGALCYLAHDPNQKAELLRTIERMSQSPFISASYVDDLRCLQAPEERVDLVLLCNVLHEIPVTQWLKVFEEARSVLADRGYLVVMEDQEPGIGELPHRDGFVILDQVEVRRLFGEDKRVRQLEPAASGRYGGRLTAIAVPKSALPRATATTIGAALKAVRERAETQLRRLRNCKGARNFRQGRQHALYAMLWVNADLAMGTYPPPPEAAVPTGSPGGPALATS